MEEQLRLRGLDCGGQRGEMAPPPSTRAGLLRKGVDFISLSPLNSTLYSSCLTLLTDSAVHQVRKSCRKNRNMQETMCAFDI